MGKFIDALEKLADQILEEDRMKKITDPKFKYTPAAETDIRKTFARVRREQQQKVKTNQPIKLEERRRVKR